jgi:transcriptional regulator GlxA family with amidase domain
MDAREDTPLRVSDLADDVGVSERTLRTAFNEYFGASPLRYLQ